MTAGARRDEEVALWRLYVLRANYLLWAVAGVMVALPPLLSPDPAARGMIDSMFGGLWVMGILGVRYPLLMLPIFLFEFVWKTIWLLAFGLPQWMAGNASDRLNDDLIGIGNGPILFGLIIPWGYVWRHYIRAPTERWR
ncbi:hypothetical protein [Allosphingosinicella sp.]|jgi:hypothetical protein|uniref:hypothetical protein n=1 Tax=Allosphingosinicella sp. TaxID=2823234 RepID=UPI002F1EA580